MSIKEIFKGISWQNPMFNSMAHIIDVPDGLIRFGKGISHLPPYSVRIRSNGVTKQFGGNTFLSLGKKIAMLLKEHTHLSASDKIMEIGCGCGRTAFALASYLDNGNYIGWDIDKISIRSCLKNSVFFNKNFKFRHLDIYNALYNSLGKQYANTYCFPYNEETFDVVFLISVFTHMLPDDVANYISEIGRILKPGGKCMVSTFLLDDGIGEGAINFKFQYDHYAIYQQEIPEKAVGYKLNFFENEFSKAGMFKKNKLTGTWRSSDKINLSVDFSQDILIFQKEIKS